LTNNTLKKSFTDHCTQVSNQNNGIIIALFTEENLEK